MVPPLQISMLHLQHPPLASQPTDLPELALLRAISDLLVALLLALGLQPMPLLPLAVVLLESRFSSPLPGHPYRSLLLPFQ